MGNYENKVMEMLTKDHFLLPVHFSFFFFNVFLQGIYVTIKTTEELKEGQAWVKKRVRFLRRYLGQGPARFLN